MSEVQTQSGDRNPGPSVVEALSKIHLFEGIAPTGLRRIAEIATEETHRLGQYIFREGESGNALYLIMEGKVRISREVSGMGEEALAVLGPGDAFGEMSLIDDFPRSADAKVHERCQVLVISKDALESLLFLHKDLAYEVLWSVVRMLTQRLRETNDKLTFLTVTGKF
jgi:CRP-like cAMP-binding protein